MKPPQQSLGYSGTFFQNIENLVPGTTYHFRAVAQGNYGTIYGQDMTFYTTGGSTNPIYTGTGTLSATKQVINLSSGNLSWQASVNGEPGDILSFAITLQAENQDIHNVFVRDTLPANLIYKGNFLANGSSNFSGDPTAGINIGTIPAGQSKVVSYQVQVAGAGNFSFGATTLNNSATVTSTEAGTQTASASVIVNKQLVYGASTSATSVSTGMTNNPVTDSFFLPIMLIILCSWLYFSGKVYVFADCLGTKIK
jgi:hypothetical protein